VRAEAFYKIIVICLLIATLIAVGCVLSWGISVYAPQPKYEKGFLLTKLVFEYPVNGTFPVVVENSYNFSVRVWAFVTPQNASRFVVYSVVPNLNGTVLEAKETKIFTFHVTFLKSDIQEAQIRIEGEKL